MGSTIIGLIIHGPTDQHSYSGHLQLAQQLMGVMGHSSSGLTLFGPSPLHFYQEFASTGLTTDTEHLPPNPSPLAGQSHVSFSPTSASFPASNYMPNSVSLEQPSPPTHAFHPATTTHPIYAPPQIYTNPIISLPHSPFQICSSQPTYPSYLYAPISHHLPTRTFRSSTRHHPYRRKGYVSAVRGVSHTKEVYRSPLSELSQITGHKRVAVSEAS
jgi:hypothetical protein